MCGDTFKNGILDYEDMTYLKMYTILEEMVGYARQDNSERVSALNTSFESLFSQMYPHSKTEVGLLYDNCRQSCLMAGRMPNMRQDFLDDAIQRFSQITKPIN